jgi:hypothetical protein
LNGSPGGKYAQEKGRTVETAVEARVGFRDRPVLRVLVPVSFSRLLISGCSGSGLPGTPHLEPEAARLYPYV